MKNSKIDDRIFVFCPETHNPLPVIYPICYPSMKGWRNRYPSDSAQHKFAIFFQEIHMNQTYVFNNYNRHHDEITEIEKTIRAHIGWAENNKNRESLISTIVETEELFLFQPGSKDTIIGFENLMFLVDSVFMSDDFKAIRTEIRDLRIHLSPSLKTSWFSCILDDINEFRGELSAWENARWTGVLEKCNGKWKIFQMHFSKAEDLTGTK